MVAAFAGEEPLTGLGNGASHSRLGLPKLISQFNEDSLPKTTAINKLSVDHLSLRLSSQVILGHVKLSIKATDHGLYANKDHSSAVKITILIEQATPGCSDKK